MGAKMDIIIMVLIAALVLAISAEPTCATMASMLLIWMGYKLTYGLFAKTASNVR